MRYEIRPLGPWLGPKTDPRRTGNQFRADWDSTLSLLRDEVDRLDGYWIVVQVDADPKDIRRDGMLRQRAYVGFPGVRVSFDSRHGELTYATDAYEDWRANVRAIALALGALRAVDRYGVSSTGEQYRGWTAIAAAPDERELDARAAASLLAEHAGPSFDPDGIRLSPAGAALAFRRAALRCHPDHGGDAELFGRLVAARDLLVGAGRG